MKRSAVTLPALLVASVCLFLNVADAAVISNTTKLAEGQLRYHYDDSSPNQCNSVMMIGVGTAMRVTDYDLISADIVKGKSVVAIFIDHVPGFFVKTSAKKYARLVDAIAKDIVSLVPACRRGTPDNGFIVGGHSASGQAAINALELIKNFSPAGFFGLDPFRVPKRQTIDIPAMFWGFLKTTCAVKVNQAAKEAYAISMENERVFYQIDNTPNGRPTHCVFTDKGCFGLVCPCGDFDYIRSFVGDSVKRFLAAIASQTFFKPAFQLSGADDVNLFVNDDTVPSQSEGLFSSLRNSHSFIWFA